MVGVARRTDLSWPDTRCIPQMDKLFSGSILVFCGLLLRTGLLLIFEVIAARHLGPASYGLFSLAFTVIVFTSLSREFGDPTPSRAAPERVPAGT